MNTPQSASLYRWLSITAIVLLLDQLSKWSALVNLQLGVPREVFDCMNWLLLYNPGAAFSFLAQGAGWQRWLLTIMGISASVFIVFLLHRNKENKPLSLSLSLILGGAIGNVLDRLMYGAVVDFIDLHYGNWHWPAFNLADSAISLGAVFIIFSEIRREIGRLGKTK